MKKIATVLILFLLVLTACSKGEPVPEPKPAVAKEPATQVVVESKPSAQQPALPADTYKISASDLADPITMKYKIDPEDIGIVKQATFDIRNFGDKPIKPVVMFYVGSESGSDVKRFDYEELPAGYKMIKTEQVNMAVSGLQDVNAIKADLRDGNSNDKLIGTSSHNYIAKPAYD